MSRESVPTVLYNEGETHECAARVTLANTTGELLNNVEIQRHDVGSWDNNISEGQSNKHFESVFPGELIVIDELSSFDLEFINSYSIRYKILKHASVISFTIGKYGKFEHDEKVGDNLGNALKGIKIKTEKI